jgi:WD40 repeat protein
MLAGSFNPFTEKETPHVYLWDMPTGKLRHTLPVQISDRTAVAPSPDGRTLAVGDVMTLTLWDLQRLKLRRRLRQIDSRLSQGEIPAWVHSLAISPDGKTLASAHDDIGVPVKLWHMRTGKLKHMCGFGDSTSNIAFSPDGRIVASGIGAIDGGVKLWSVSTGRLLKTLGKEDDWPTSIAFSPGGTMLADDGAEKLRFWNLKSGKVVRTLTGHGPLAFAPDGRVLLSDGGNGIVKWTQVGM